jgi:Cof subfamily protein (haloacid dehalogenase superfamily)
VPKTKSQENRYARSKPAPESVLRAEAVSGQRDIRLVLADVDGTLVTQRKALTDAAIDAVRQLHDSGIMFTITSGRPPRGMSMLIEPLALREAIAGFNGGVFVHPDLSVIESHTLDPATAKEALNLIRDKGLDAWVYTEADWLIRDKAAPHVAHETETVQFDAKIVASFTDAQLARAVKIVGVSDDLDLVAACEKLVQDKLGERASAARSQPYYLDVTHPHANKGTVVVTLSKLLNIPPGQIATIGDMPNDVLMFRKSGFSIAMGNASDAVKAQASAATDSNEDDGFAKAIRKFVL